MRRRVSLSRSHISHEAVEALDRELASVAQKSGSLRLALALGLDALARTDGHHDLSFSSLIAYGSERCERSATWIRQSRRLARKTQNLPLLRAALISGRISWSLALELVKVAAPETEAAWLQRAQGRTVKQLRDEVQKQLHPDRDRTNSDADEAEAARVTLTVTANCEDVWLFQAASTILREAGAQTIDDVVDGLVAEASHSLFEEVPRESFDLRLFASSNDAQLAHNRELARWQDEAERLCEPRIPRWSDQHGKGAANVAELEPSIIDDALPDFSGSPADIDRALRQISGELERRDLVIGELVDRLWTADGWRRLGYAAEAQYCRERLGMKKTAVKDKRQFACSLRRRPHIRAAFQERRIGYEAARLVARVATPETDERWAIRAAERTVVHLAEDVEVAEQRARLRGEAIVPPSPPSDEDVYKLRAVKTAVVTGDAFREQPSGGRKSPGDDLAADILAVYASAARTPCDRRSLARETLRLRIDPELRTIYRGFEQVYLRHTSFTASFLRFACEAVIEEWARELPPVAFSHIYARDGLRCANPCCTRRDVTPHHIIYVSRGGTDEAGNLIALCVWCHLEGVHGGRLTVSGEAPGALTWMIGDHTVVEGRTRRRVAQETSGEPVIPGRHLASVDARTRCLPA